EGKIACLRGGEIPIHEPGLDALVARNVKDGRLRFSSDVAGAVSEADVVFIAVGTPAAADGAADMSAVHAVANTIGCALRGYTVVVTKSTVPVGTAERVQQIIAGCTDEPFAVVANPEFLKE